jgi:hypothetical protein
MRRRKDRRPKTKNGDSKKSTDIKKKVHPAAKIENLQRDDQMMTLLLGVT